MSRPAAITPPGPPWKWVWAFVLPDRRERVKLTFAGYTLCAVAVALAAAAYNNASNILFLALSLTLAMFGLSGVLSWLNFFRLGWSLTPPARARAGEVAVARLVVRNGRRALPAYALRFGFEAAGEAPATVRLREPLEAGAACELPVDFTPARRGALRLCVEGATSSHPFALMHKSELRPVTAEVLVLPARIPYTFAGDGCRRLRREGDRLRRGPGAELLGLREYRPGDPPRIIHWKISAKRGRPIVRETSEPGDAGYALWLDAADFVTAPAAWEKAVSCAASLAEDLWREGRLAGAGVAPAGVIPVRRIHDLHEFLDTLAACPEAPAVTGASSAGLPAETLRFLPGPGDLVHVVLGTRVVGEA